MELELNNFLINLYPVGVLAYTWHNFNRGYTYGEKGWVCCVGLAISFVIALFWPILFLRGIFDKLDA